MTTPQGECSQWSNDMVSVLRTVTALWACASIKKSLDPLLGVDS